MIEVKLSVSESLVDAARKTGGAFRKQLEYEFGRQAYLAAERVVAVDPERPPIVTAEAE